MRVVFVDNVLFEDAENVRRYVLQPHLGLISLIAVLNSAGHEGMLFDPKVEVSRGNLQLNETLYRRMAERILAMEPDVVGFTSLGCNFICTAKTAGYLRSWRPDLTILLGGPHASVLDRQILGKFPQFDVILRNEAERTLLPTLDALSQQRLPAVPGISFRFRGDVRQNPDAPIITDLDALPMPAYYKYPIRELGLQSLRVDAGRGCPFQCTFCSTASFFGRKYRLKSADRLVRELDELYNTYGIRDFSLTHDLFTVNRNKVREFCQAVQGRGYTWKCSARMDCVDTELLEVMAAAGCRSIYYGIEAGSERMQKISKKHLDLGLFDSRLRVTQRLGMSATTSFITGYPEESDEDQNATLDLIGTCFSYDQAPLNVQLHLLTPEPGTELLNRYGSQIAYDGHISDFNFPTLEADDGQVIGQHADVFINHHYFPSLLPRDRHVFVTTAYQALYGIGFPVLRYIIRRFDNKLSGLVGLLWKWAKDSGEPVRCDEATIERFFEAHFGASNHITGLVRYMSHAAELRRRAINDTPVRKGARLSDPTLYKLSERSVVLRCLPDCARILDYLIVRNGERIDSALLRPRYDFLLHLPPGETELVTNFVVNEPGAALLEYFRQPHRWPDHGAFERHSGYPSPPPEFVESLIAHGVLEHTSDVMQQ